MLEIIAGAALGVVTAITAAGVTHHRAKRVQSHLVRPARFERELNKVARENPAALLKCSFCHDEVPASDAKIIFRTTAGEKGIVCNKTECLLNYMRTTAQTEPVAKHAPAGAA